MMWQALLFLVVLGSQTTVTITIGENGMAQIHQEIQTASQGGHLTLTIPFRIKEETLIANIEGIPVTGEVRQISGMTVLDFLWEGEEEVLVELDYYVSDITGKEKDMWYLEIPPLSCPVSVRLPENASVEYIVYEGNFPRIRHEGERFVLEWETLSHPLTAYYSFESVTSTTSTTLPLLVLLFFLITASLLVILYISRMKRKKSVNTSILSVLDERERAIVLFLAERGKIKQAKISRATGIPKTTLSKIMMRLDERNIVAMEKDGNTTLCWLREEVFR